MKRARKETFSFTLVLAGVTEVTEDLENALFEAGCDDALLGMRDGVLFLDFDREGPSWAEAILSAIADVQRSDGNAWVARIEPDDLVTASEIARRLQRSRESIRQLAQGERGPGRFPPPVANLTRRSPIWRWAEVAHWFGENYAESDRALIEKAMLIASLNSAIELSRHVDRPSIINRLWRVLGTSARVEKRKAAKKKA